MAKLETVIGSVERRKKFGVRFKKKKFPEPRIWPISLKTVFFGQKIDFSEKILQVRQKIVEKFYGLKSFPVS